MQLDNDSIGLIKEEWEYFQLAERYCLDIPNFSLICLRALGSLLTNRLFNHLNIEIEGSFFEKLGLMKDHIPSNILDKLHFIRMEGNRGAHPEDKPRSISETEKATVESLKVSYYLACWYLNEYHQVLLPSDQDQYELPDDIHKGLLCEAAVFENDSNAQYQIGLIFKNKSDEHANEEKMKLAKQSFLHGLDAMEVSDPYDLLPTYKRDFDSDEHLISALDWFTKSSKNGNENAQYQLYLALVQGWGGNKDPVNAFKALEQSANKGVIDAIVSLGLLHIRPEVAGGDFKKPDIHEGIRLLEIGAFAENRDALEGLFWTYIRPEFDADNPSKAFEYAKMSSDFGYAQGHYNVGFCYANGIGVDQNDEKAMDYFERAIDDGYALAMTTVGLNLIMLEGREREVGLHLFKEAAELQEANACHALMVYHAQFGDPILACRYGFKAYMFDKEGKYKNIFQSEDFIESMQKVEKMDLIFDESKDSLLC